MPDRGRVRRPGKSRDRFGATDVVGVNHVVEQFGDTESFQQKRCVAAGRCQCRFQPCASNRFDRDPCAGQQVLRDRNARSVVGSNRSCGLRGLLFPVRCKTRSLFRAGCRASAAVDAFEASPTVSSNGNANLRCQLFPCSVMHDGSVGDHAVKVEDHCLQRMRRWRGLQRQMDRRPACNTSGSP